VKPDAFFANSQILEHKSWGATSIAMMLPFKQFGTELVQAHWALPRSSWMLAALLPIQTMRWEEAVLSRSGCQ
jgi:hypothetical protein